MIFKTGQMNLGPIGNTNALMPLQVNYFSLNCFSLSKHLKILLTLTKTKTPA